MGVPGTGPRRSCYSDTGMLAMPLSKVTENFLKRPVSVSRSPGKSVSGAREVLVGEGRGRGRRRPLDRVFGRIAGARRAAFQVYGKERKEDRGARAGRLIVARPVVRSSRSRTGSRARDELKAPKGKSERERKRGRGRGRRKRRERKSKSKSSRRSAGEEQQGDLCAFYPRSPSRDVPADTGESRGARGGEKSGKARGESKRKRLRARTEARERRTEAASRRVLPRRARSDAARLPRRGTRSWRGWQRGGRGGGGKDAHSFLESRGPLLITELFPFVPREIRTPYARLLNPPPSLGGGVRPLVRYRTPRSSTTDDESRIRVALFFQTSTLISRVIFPIFLKKSDQSKLVALPQNSLSIHLGPSIGYREPRRFS